MYASTTQLCLTLCKSTDYSLPSSSVHGILQARILEWVAISFSKKEIRLEYYFYEKKSLKYNTRSSCCKE